MKKYGSSIQELKGQPDKYKSDALPGESSIESLFNEDLIESGTSRRDFLKLCGFSISAAALAAGCEGPVKKAIPFLAKPEDVTPGVANHYASTYIDGSEYCSILVKVRDGRPIKIEGNALSSITRGGTNARVQASVLSLYDSSRLKNPLSKGEKESWKEVHDEIKANIEHIVSKEQKLVLLTAPLISPSERQAVKDFLKKYPTAQLIVYEPVSFSGMLTANANCFGMRTVPSYDISKSKLIVSFGADFLGTWLSPVEFTKQYSQARKLSKDNTRMLRHIQFESGMSLSGANADERHPIKPSQEKTIITALYNQIASKAGAPSIPGENTTETDITSLASELWENRKQSIIISGSNDIAVQTLVNGLNHLLGNYGNTIDFSRSYNLKQANDAEMVQLVKEMNAKKIRGIIINKVNPAYDYFEADQFINGLKNTDISVTITDRVDETALHTDYVLPVDHYLESWGDAEPKKGMFSLTQPTIKRLFNTCSFLECILAWTGDEITTAYDYIKKHWEQSIFTLQDSAEDFNAFWIKSLQDGVFEVKSSAGIRVKEKTTDEEEESQPDILTAVAEAAGMLPSDQNTVPTEVVLHESIALGTGSQANNPWLLELDDPITKVAWDNVACIPVQYAEEQHLSTGDVIQIGKGLQLPVVVQPGQAEGTVSVALGFGRTHVGHVGNHVGENTYPLVVFKDGVFLYQNNLPVTTTQRPVYALSLTQTHHSMEGRPIVKEATLSEYTLNPAAGNEDREEIQKELVSPYPKQEYPGHHWGMSVDLNACTGCGACIIACQAENNIAVVGKEEVRKRRNMHWIRIDRYYSDNSQNPSVNTIPVMCQQCDNAPCENVCPVAATMHSNEGINQMAYNRCIGTRYCMNNCPYKVRRFNWYNFVKNQEFDYNMNDDLGRMVLNPDVVVRCRGVAEKCTFCTQRIQEAKLKAKLDNRPLQDGDIQTACMQSCPANAITFGDLNDKNSRVSQLFEDERNYHLLEELHVLPSVGYMTKIRNKKTEKES